MFKILRWITHECYFLKICNCTYEWVTCESRLITSWHNIDSPANAEKATNCDQSPKDIWFMVKWKHRYCTIYMSPLPRLCQRHHKKTSLSWKSEYFTVHEPSLSAIGFWDKINCTRKPHWPQSQSSFNLLWKYFQ